MQDPRLQFALACSLLATTGTASANDFTAGGTPSDLVPVSESRVSMASEDILMEYSDGEWLVTADYVFLNSSDELVAQQIGFPELNCDPNQGYDCAPDAFKNLRTTVDGKLVAHRKGKISETHEWSKDLGTVWLFDASFAPKKPTKIAHSYQVFTGGNLSWVYDISYLVKTGRGWAGKIGSATFRVKLPPAAHTVVLGDYPNPPKFVQSDFGQAHYLLKRSNTDWVPPTSIGMAFIFTAWSDVNERLGDDRFSRSGVQPEDECASPLAPETAAQAQMCKNLIYAISGYPFKSAKLRKYFYGNQFEWRPMKGHWLGDVWVRGLRPFENFDPSWIPALDRSFLRNLETLKFDGEGESESLPASPPKKTAEADRRADEKVKLALANPEKAGPGKQKALEFTKDRQKPTPVPAPTPQPQQSSPQSGAGLCTSAAPTRSTSDLIFWFLTLLAAGACTRRKQHRSAE